MQVRELASIDFINKYTEGKEFDKAKELIDGIYTNSQVVNKDLLLSNLYEKMGETKKSKEILERKIYSTSGDIQLYLNNLMIIYFKENNLALANHLANLSEETATVLELPTINRISSKMTLSILEKNIPDTLKYLEEYLNSILENSGMENSKIYREQKLKENFNSAHFKKTFLKMMVQGFKEDEERDKEFEFIKDNDHFKKLVLKYEKALHELEDEKTP